MFDPDQSTSGYVRKQVGDVSVTRVNLDEFKKLGVDIATAMENINRNLIAIEAAILGTDNAIVYGSLTDEGPFG